MRSDDVAQAGGGGKRGVTAQEWKNRTPNATNLSIVHFLVLPGSQSTITEITEYIYIWSNIE